MAPSHPPSRRAGTGLLLMAGAALAAAPTLPDPTRPPTLLLEAPAGASGSAHGLRQPLLGAAGRGAAATSTPAPAAAETPQVQSVRVAAQGEASALVDGRLLHVGDRLAGPWGERTITAIDELGLLLAATAKERTPLRVWLLGATAQGPESAANANAAAAATPTATSAAKLAARSTP